MLTDDGRVIIRLERFSQDCAWLNKRVKVDVGVGRSVLDRCDYLPITPASGQKLVKEVSL